MEQKLGRTPVVILTIGSAIAAYFLRLRQLQTAYDAGGRVIAGAGKGFLTWFSLAVAVLFALYAFCLRPRKKYNTISDRNPVVLVRTLPAAGVGTVDGGGVGAADGRAAGGRRCAHGPVMGGGRTGPLSRPESPCAAVYGAGPVFRSAADQRFPRLEPGSSDSGLLL